MIGPNGSGKTRQTRQLVAAMPMDFVNALRNTRVATELPAVGVDTARNNFHSQKTQSRISHWELASEFDYMLSQLLAQESMAAIEFTHRFRSDPQGAGAPEETPLRRVEQLWGRVFPGRELHWRDWKPLIKNRSTGMEFEYSGRMRAMTPVGFARWGGLSAIGFAIAAIVGLGLWFTGADMPEAHHSAADLAKRVVSIDRAIAGAWVLILAMVIMVGFSWWLLARYGQRSALVTVGAGALALAATIHLVENLLVIGLYHGIIRPMAASGASDSAAGDAIWAVVSSASVLAFGVLGLGAFMAAIGFLRDLGAPRWFAYWGVFTGVLGFAAASSGIFDGLSFLAGPFNLSLLGWLIVLGIRASTQLSSAARER